FTGLAADGDQHEQRRAPCRHLQGPGLRAERAVVEDVRGYSGLPGDEVREEQGARRQLPRLHPFTLTDVRALQRDWRHPERPSLASDAAKESDRRPADAMAEARIHVLHGQLLPDRP